MMNYRKLFGKIHLWLGFSSGLILFVVCLTGAILVFEVEIEEAFHADKFYAEKTSTQRLSVDELLEKVKETYPNRPLQRIEVDHDQMRAVRIEVGEPRTIVFINPYNAQILGAIEYEKRFFTIMLKLHRYLLAGETGKTITGIAVVIFIIMLLSGIVLWLPKNKKAFKQSFQIKWNARWRRINYDMHSVLGFYSMLLLLIIALTGTVWSFKFVNNAIYWLADGKLPDKTKVNSVHTIPEAPLKYAAMLEKTNQVYSYPGNTSINIPEDDSASITVQKEDLSAATPNIVSFIYFDQYSGEVVKTEPYTSASLGLKIRRKVYPIHTGSIFGWPTQILALVVSLFAASLPITGVAIWWGRKNKKKKVTLIQAHTRHNEAVASGVN